VEGRSRLFARRGDRHRLAVFLMAFLDAFPSFSQFFQGLYHGKKNLGIFAQRPEKVYFNNSCYAAPLYLVIDLVRRIQDIGVKQVIS
jgi:hypothetical protein